MGDGDARGGGRGEPGGDTRDHLTGDAVPRNEGALLGPPAEQVRIAALEPYHEAALPGLVDQELVGLILGELVLGGPLAHVDALGMWRRFVEQSGVGQRIENHDIGGAQPRESGNRDQSGIARARAHQANRSGLFFFVGVQDA